MKIQIKNPCSENYFKMTLNSLGRYCALCEKTVVDFTQMTPLEISQYLKQNPKTCGAFLPSQIDKDAKIVENHPFKSLFKYASITAIGLSAMQMNAQEKPNNSPEEEYIFTETEMIKNPDYEISNKVIHVTRGVVLQTKEDPALKNDDFTEHQESDTIKTEEFDRGHDTLSHIKGVIVDFDGFPIADAIIYIDYQIVSTSNLDGEFEFEGTIGDTLWVETPEGNSEIFSINKANMGEIIINQRVLLLGDVVYYSPKSKIIRGLTFPFRKVR